MASASDPAHMVAGSSGVKAAGFRFTSESRIREGMSETIDSYVEALSEPRRSAMQAIIGTIRAAAPNAVESIQWGMPCFTTRDRTLSVASQKSYISVYMCSDPELAAELRAAAPKAKGGKACVNFPDTVAVPLDALAAIVARELG